MNSRLQPAVSPSDIHWRLVRKRTVFERSNTIKFHLVFATLLFAPGSLYSVIWIANSVQLFLLTRWHSLAGCGTAPATLTRRSHSYTVRLESAKEGMEKFCQPHIAFCQLWQVESVWIHHWYINSWYSWMIQFFFSSFSHISEVRPSWSARSMLGEEMSDPMSRSQTLRLYLRVKGPETCRALPNQTTPKDQGRSTSTQRSQKRSQSLRIPLARSLDMKLCVIIYCTVLYLYFLHVTSLSYGCTMLHCAN